MFFHNIHPALAEEAKISSRGFPVLLKPGGHIFYPLWVGNESIIYYVEAAGVILLQVGDDFINNAVGTAVTVFQTMHPLEAENAVIWAAPSRHHMKAAIDSRHIVVGIGQGVQVFYRRIRRVEGDFSPKAID